ncbi:MAG: hypothetical protein JWO36_5850 [Myxococcales bacterium]|nr:hypothetical protein [Myxococcales bacterium]
MKLVEAEAEGPVEGDEAIVTPPRPAHRRVSVSLLFTLLVLTGTVVSIYTVFPAPRDNVLVTEAIEQHRNAVAWDLTTPSATELRAWALGVVGKDAPLPAVGQVVGARKIEIHHRGAAVVRVRLDGGDITYVVQHAPGISPEHAKRTDGELFASEWVNGKFTCVVVGPAATRERWLRAFGDAKH